MSSNLKKYKLKQKTMGMYVNVDSKGNALSAQGKARELISDGATIVSDDKFLDNMICVVENGFFDAAGYAFDEEEFNEFKHPDGRRKTWLVHPKAKQLAK